ncbi:aldose 1-epimerase family protein [Plantibacter sp. YIM 135347]|uniref:aldose 1-epimerase family protein n=1 Tax=Plantibacter sp. YIM 135347 TaxID=3423919 RepID=UPI003D331857
MRAVTGEQHRLHHTGPKGEVAATITALAAGIRELSVGGVSLVESYAEDSISPMGCGIVLVPWPNRVRDGKWELDGVTQQLDVTEASTGNASHGLLRNTGYTAADRADGSVLLTAEVFPQHGYPFHLETSVSYVLTDDGLDVTHRIINRSAAAAPVAVGTHPYLAFGGVPTEDLVLTVDAGSWFETDRQLVPVAEHDVSGTENDLRGGVPVRGMDLNVGLGAVNIVGGTSRHRLTAPDGRAVELWADDQFPYLQVYTPHTFPKADGPGVAVAIEPMSAPAGAFNSGQGLRWLAPEESWTLTWGIRLVG